MISVSQLKDALAVTGAVTVVAFLAFVGGTYVGRRSVERQIAATDSVQLALARTDSLADAAMRARLDSALAGWAAAAGEIDTVERPVPVPVPGKPDTIRVPSDSDAIPPAAWALRLDSVTRAGDAVVAACTALAHDCAAVRASRDSLAAALVRTRVALTAPPTFWERWHVTLGPGCAVSFTGTSACGATVAFSYQIW